jgi:hypothetical protein
MLANKLYVIYKFLGIYFVRFIPTAKIEKQFRKTITERYILQHVLSGFADATYKTCDLHHRP